MNIYEIRFENYCGDFYSEYYKDESNARARMFKLWQEAQDKEEIEGDWNESFSFFDACYNEYSTDISLISRTLESLFCD